MSAIRKKVRSRSSLVPPPMRRRTRVGRRVSARPHHRALVFSPRAEPSRVPRLPPRRDADRSPAPFLPRQIVKDDGAALSEFEKEVAQVRVGSQAPTPAEGSAFPGIAVRVFLQCARGREVAMCTARRRARAWSIEDPRRPGSAARECIGRERSVEGVRTPVRSSRLAPRAHAVAPSPRKTTPRGPER